MAASASASAAHASLPVSLARRVLPFLVLFLAASLLVRLSLAARVVGQYADTPFGWYRPFLVGAVYDLAAYAAFGMATVLWWLLMPSRYAGGRIDRLATVLAFGMLAFTLLFTGVAEHFFWIEFGTRFNFIAVDYLIYTQEVLGNIWESYPIIPLVGGVIVAAGLIVVLFRKLIAPAAGGTSGFIQRLPVAAAALALPVVLLASLSSGLAVRGTNAFGNELTLNGIWALFSAFRNNEIDYRRFYRVADDGKVLARMRELNAEPGNPFVDAGRDPLTRDIRRTGDMVRKNVMLVGLESMGAEYMEAFGNAGNITPNLDRIAKEGLFFTRLLATGTRTVRGLEALTLSVPPTPGQSIVRRPGNDNLYSLGWVFKDRGYDTRFLYGGYGYFDNMNDFFRVNGFDVTDRTDIAKKDIQFENVWGVSDEDLYKRSIIEADTSHAAGKPFFQFVMTTSNHRPFTYPGGRIDILSKSGRLGGVKYADYAIGNFLKAAAAKPWFKDTVFLFIGDHTAGTAGRVELDPGRYHVVGLAYAPGFIKPQRYDKLASQIDIPPTLLGLLNTSYRSRFYGRDVLADPNAPARAYIGIYQKVGLVRDGKVVVLGPKATVESFAGTVRQPDASADPEMLADAIATYQFASGWSVVSRRIDTRIAPLAVSGALR